MSVFQAIVLGIVQGLAEFLPISSSAHLRLTPWLFGWQEPGLAFDVALHLGTLIALVWFFWNEWVTLTKAFFSGMRKLLTGARPFTESERRFLWVTIATIPGGLAGFLLQDFAEGPFRNPVLNGVMLIVMGAILWAVDRFARQDRGIPDMRLKDAILVGVAQMFAIIPGVSRSGSTITAGRAIGLSREAAAVFSFMMSLPIIVAAVVFKGSEAIEHGITLPLVAGVIAAAVSGWLAIAVLLKFVARNNYAIFAVYRLVFGGLILIIAALRA